MVASATGPPNVSNKSKSRAVPRAFCESRLTAETSNPPAREQNSALHSASEVLHTCSPVTPPMSSVIPRIGTMARNAKKPRSDVASNFPAATS